MFLASFCIIYSLQICCLEICEGYCPRVWIIVQQQTPHPRDPPVGLIVLAGNGHALFLFKVLLLGTILPNPNPFAGYSQYSSRDIRAQP
jgi:hypothetical protein